MNINRIIAAVWINENFDVFRSYERYTLSEIALLEGWVEEQWVDIVDALATLENAYYIIRENE